jgi:hypothetical protein
MTRTFAFQYATRHKVYEDTGLIAEDEARALWEKYLPDVRQKISDGEEPQMVIWCDAKGDSDECPVYHKRYSSIGERGTLRVLGERVLEAIEERVDVLPIKP